MPFACIHGFGFAGCGNVGALKHEARLETADVLFIQYVGTGCWNPDVAIDADEIIAR